MSALSAARTRERAFTLRASSVRRQRTVSPAAFTTFPQRSESDRIFARSASGASVSGSTEAATSFARISGLSIAAAVSRLSLSTTARGVPARVKIAYH
jgi:hypothetical protein